MPKKTTPAKKSPPDKAPPFESDLRAELEELKNSMAAQSEGRPRKEIPKGTCDPESIEIFHQKGEGSYWMREVDEDTKAVEYVKYKPARLVSYFKWLGMTEAFYRRGLREIDWPMHMADRYRRIDYCGPLAGHPAGLFKDRGGRTFLVSSQARDIWNVDFPNKGFKPGFIFDFMQELLQSPGEFDHVHYWLASRLRSLLRRDFRPGPVLGLAGDANSGKSLLQYIITQILGGRAADPWKYMTGEEKHNTDMIGAEHWCIEDPPSTVDHRTRGFFTSMIKAVCFVENFRLRAMAKDPLSAPLGRSFSFSANANIEEPQNLATFPFMDRSMMDKVSMVACHNVTEAFKRFDVPANQIFLPNIPSWMRPVPGDQDRNLVKDTIEKELFEYRGFLLEKFSAPPTPFDRARIGKIPDMANRRTGITAYQNPTLLEAVQSLAPHMRMLVIIDEVLFTAGNPPGSLNNDWEGRACELEKRLTDSDFRDNFLRLMSRGDNLCPTYLGKLRQDFPNRFERVPGAQPRWIIKPPKFETEPEEKNGYTETQTDSQN